ncbi:MAG: late competence development ComFB family protein [Treponema sp.]|jgi:competence protein ComFB|nr:late competence development ComFB family protein [Treponema sp.]
MELHNTVEDIVISKVTEIFDSIAESENPECFCTCDHCRMDTVCFVLNRARPHYIVSNRGVARVDQETTERQQEEVDIVSLIYEGIRRVNHNLRPNIVHRAGGGGKPAEGQQPVYNIPTIVGRIFNGRNFAPVSDVKVELYHNGELIAMKDNNWQNPYKMVSNTEGTFSFWPSPVPAKGPNEHKVFEFTIKAESPDYETLNHFFKIPVISDTQSALAYSMERTIKLPNLFMFPPGSDEGGD